MNEINYGAFKIKKNPDGSFILIALTPKVFNLNLGQGQLTILKINNQIQFIHSEKYSVYIYPHSELVKVIKR